MLFICASPEGIGERAFVETAKPIPVQVVPRKKTDLETVLQSEPVKIADLNLRLAVEETEAMIRQIFCSARQGCPQFAEKAFSFQSKFMVLSDMMPYTRKDRFQIHLRDSFRETVFPKRRSSRLLRER